MIFEKEIAGVKFKARYSGITKSAEIQEACLIEGTDIINTYKLAQVLFENVFIEPRELDFEYFDGFDDPVRVLEDVIAFGVRAMQGKSESELTDRELRAKISSEWGAWRLIFSDMGNFTHDYVFHHMTPQEIREANLALDRVIKQLNRRSKGG